MESGSPRPTRNRTAELRLVQTSRLESETWTTDEALELSPVHYLCGGLSVSLYQPSVLNPDLSGTSILLQSLATMTLYRGSHVTL